MVNSSSKVLGDVLDRALDNISPSKFEHNNNLKIVDSFLKILRNSAKCLDFDCEFFVGGSFGKNTYLKDNFDVDVFCRFSLTFPEECLSSNLKKILEKTGISFSIEKGSRDYFNVNFGLDDIFILFEVIPVRRIVELSDALNSTDLSVFHVNFLKVKINDDSKICNEIRLAKQFFKAKALYGAESYIGGFSGHSIDLLILHFGSLKNLLNSAKSWGENFVLDINEVYNTENSLRKALSSSKASNLIIIDPILVNRNASRALSSENYFKFLNIANFFKDFKTEDFLIQTLTLKEILTKNKSFANKCGLKLVSYEFQFDLDSSPKDIVGSKLQKLFGRTFIYFEKLDFKPFKGNFYIDFEKKRAIFVFLFEQEKISKLKLILGPFVVLNEACKEFIRKNGVLETDIIVFNKRVCFYKERKVFELEKVVNLELADFKDLFAKDLSFLKSLERK